MRLNVSDFTDATDAMQATLDAAVDGDSIYVTPPIAPYKAPSGGWKIKRNIELFGDGPGPVGTALAAALTPFNASNPVFEIVPPVSSVYIHDVQFQGVDAGVYDSNGVAIRCRSDATNPTMGGNIQLRGLQISGFSGNGIHLEGYDANTARINGVTIADCRVRNCFGAGVLLKNAVEVHLASVILEGNHLHGLAAEGGRVALYACTLDGNCSAVTGANDGNLKLKDCQIARVEACRFLNFGSVGTINKACVFEGGLAIIGSCYFIGHPSTNAGQGIVVTSSTSPGQPSPGPIAILGNRFARTSTLINVSSAVIGCTAFPQYSENAGGTITLPAPNNGLVAAPHVIRTGNGSNITGLIIPSGSTDPTSVPTDGMLAYNTTLNALRLRVNGQWKTVETHL